MAKRGRPRRSGARKPCGRLRLHLAPDRGTRELLRHRRAITGRADDPRACYALGALNARGLLDDAELRAGDIYAALYYAGVAPPAIPSLLSHLIVSDTPVALRDPDDEIAATRRRRFLDARSILAQAGVSAAAAVDATAVFDQIPLFADRLDALRRGLIALKAHFRIW